MSLSANNKIYRPDRRTICGHSCNFKIIRHSVGQFLPPNALQCGLAIACRLSVRPSVCDVNWIVMTDDVGWNSSKIISRLVNLGCSLSADPNMSGLLQGEHPEIFRPNGGGVRKKSDFWRTKALIFLKRGKTGPRLLSLLMRTNRKS